MSTTTMTTID
uniref:Uncharacterized protein n=1 Tax=Arundo donax TaxID=35708 RepID=A0A0A9FUC0_ARUDO